MDPFIAQGISASTPPITTPYAWHETSLWRLHKDQSKSSTNGAHSALRFVIAIRQEVYRTEADTTCSSIGIRFLNFSLRGDAKDTQDRITGAYRDRIAVR